MRGLLLSAFTAVAALCFSTCAAQAAHSFSVEDDIAMIHFSDPSEEDLVATPEDAAASPDQRSFAVVTTRGLLVSDEIESMLSIFDVQEVQRYLRGTSDKPPRPRIIAVIAAVPHEEETHAFASVIRDVRWSDDGTHLFFRGRARDGGFRLYRVAVESPIPQALSPEGRDVNQYDQQGSALVYSYAAAALSDQIGSRINRDAWDVTGSRLKDIVFPNQMSSYSPKIFKLGSIRFQGTHAVASDVPHFQIAQLAMSLDAFPFQLSPNGDKLLLATPTDPVPSDWSQYDPALHFDNRRLRVGDPELISPSNLLRPRQYSVVDLSTGRQRVIVDAPVARWFGYTGDRNEAAWSPDGSRLLVTNTFLPFSNSSYEQSRLPCALAEVELESHKTSCLHFELRSPASSEPHVRAIAFGKQGKLQELLRSRQGAYTVRTFRSEHGRWEIETETPTTHSTIARQGDASHEHPVPLHIFVKQDLNASPELWAIDLQTGRSRSLWNPNPQLQSITMGEASVYRWDDSNGTEWIGGLVKPVGYQRGKRYPLVIQMYDFEEHRFLTDGTDPSAFSARHLASAGFVILQIRKKPNVLSEEDPAVHLEAYRSAIRSLVQEGLVEPSRVGVVGFSWTCWYVINALIKEPHLFAAATIADGLDQSYMQYLLFSPGPPITHEQMEQIRGSAPFGSGLERWVRDAPGFHLDSVVTPVRIEAINPASVLQEWELYSSLTMQNKPVDMIYFPNGTHIHQLPQERMESQQGNVDWMRFWLQDYEAPDTAKRAQYERWEKLRQTLMANKEPAS